MRSACLLVVATVAVAGVASSVSARQLRPAAAPDARSVVLGEGLDAVRLDVLGERLFRARVAWTNEWTESPWNRYGVYHPEAFTNEAFEAAGDAVRSAGGDLSGTADGALHFHSKVSPADVKLKLGRSGKGFRIEVDLADGERLFGLGDCGRETLNRRGGKHRSTIEVYKQPREKGHRYWCAAPVPMLTSSRGWGLLVNSSFLLNWDIGATDKDKLVITAEEGDADIYLFCGNGPRELLDVYTRFTGRPAMLPCFGLGLTFVCNEHTGMHELLDYARLFREQGIPCDTMSLEPNWMSTWYDATTGKDWDRNVFKFRRPWEKSDGTWIDAHQRMGFKLGLWMCCNYDLTRCEEEQQVGRNIGAARREDETFGFSEEIDTGLFGVNQSVGKSASKTAATAGDGSEPWFEHWKKFIDQGVRVFKLDGSQQMNPDPQTIANGMSKSELLNCYNALYQKQMTQGFSRHTGKRPFVISAAGSLGTQQYGTTWAGDTYGSEFSVVSILNMGLSGHPNHSMDMCVWGANSFHAGFLTTWPMLCDFAMWKAPWQMAESDRDAFIAYAKLRYRLIPYFYSFAAEAHRTGFPYVRAMPLAYPDDPQWDDKRRQWMLGDSLLVSAYDDRVTLPPGTWYDWRNDHRLEGGQTVPVVRDAEWGGSLHVKAGAIVPTWENVSHIEKGWNERLSLHVWPQADGAFTLYEDDGDSLDFQKGAFSETPITVKTVDGVTRLAIGKRKGAFAGMPGSRAVTVVFHLGEGETKTCAVGAVGTEGAVVILDKQGARVDRKDVFNGSATPAAGYPSGCVMACPDTSEHPEAFHADMSHTCGYRHGDGWLWRFSQTHAPGTGCSSFGDFGLLPYPDGFDGTISPARLHKATERAAPGFYGVTLGEPVRLDVLNSEQRVDCEMTATARTVAYRFRYPKGFTAKLLLDLDWGIGGCRGKRVYSSVCTFTADRTAEGGRKVTNGNDYEAFFAASFSCPIVAKRLVRQADGVRGDVYELEFGNLPDNTLEVRLALSDASSAAAVRNLKDESTGRTFDELREQAFAAWQQSVAGRLEPAKMEDVLLK